MSDKTEKSTEEQRQLLTKLITKYKHVLENKKTDKVSNQEKIKCWDKLKEEFNSQQLGRAKTVKQLKTCFNNMKLRYRRDVALKKKDLFQTGGGPSSVKDVEVDSALAELVTPSITPQQNYFDDDGDMDMLMKE